MHSQSVGLEAIINVLFGKAYFLSENLERISTCVIMP